MLALGGGKPDENYDDANKRHTMSHPPDHIPDMDNMSPAKTKSPKEKKEKKDKIKDKVRGTMIIIIVFIIIICYNDYRDY